MNNEKEKFTPGPWYFEKNAARCEVKMAGGSIALPHSDEANARLIAAAPEMYAVLVGVLKVLDVIDFEITIEKRDLREIVSNVLKKARGEK